MISPYLLDFCPVFLLIFSPLETADFLMLLKPTGDGYSLLYSKKHPPRHISVKIIAVTCIYHRYSCHDVLCHHLIHHHHPQKHHPHQPPDRHLTLVLDKMRIFIVRGVGDDAGKWQQCGNDKELHQ